MEWVRTLYQGSWRLFRGRPDLLTAGRYWKAEPGTPHYPGPHNLWSRDWTADRYDPPEEATLGEARQAPRSYKKLPLVGRMPGAVLVGSDTCVAGGDVYPLPLSARKLYSGFDLRCWTLAGRLPPVQPEPNMWKVSLLAPHNVPTGPSKLSWDSIVADLDGWWPPGGGDTATCPVGKSGWYWVYANTRLNGPTATGYWRVELIISRNSAIGNEYCSVEYQVVDTGDDLGLEGGAMIPFNEGDTTEVWIVHTNPNTLQEFPHNASGDTVPSFGAFRISDL